MCEITDKEKCPHCLGTKVVKNGHKRNGSQNFLCKECGKQFQNTYIYTGAIVNTRLMIVSMLLRNCGIRDISALLKVSRKCVLNCLIRSAASAKIAPKKSHYKSVQIDEHWSYVGNKKNKRWLIYAYSPENEEIIAYVIGKRNIKTTRELYQKLKGLQIDEICTDNWKAFATVFAEFNHQIGKEFTKHIEGVNNSFRVRNRRLVRKTTCFSKKEKYHHAAIKLMIAHRNNQYHTI